MATAGQMNPNKALWEKGDFTQIAYCMRESGSELVDSLGLTPEMRGLDLSCGDGTTALPKKKKGADVIGVDIAANLVAAGNTRAKEAGLANLKFEEGDASNLENIGDNAFDLVVSIFGAMFAPRPNEVASEMVRVTKPGGRIVIVDYHKPSLWHPMRLLMRLVFSRLEPFAMDLWRNELSAFFPEGIRLAAKKKSTFFGGLYQMLVIER